jgi:hypothetical protein
MCEKPDGSKEFYEQVFIQPRRPQCACGGQIMAPRRHQRVIHVDRALVTGVLACHEQATDAVASQWCRAPSRGSVPHPRRPRADSAGDVMWLRSGDFDPPLTGISAPHMASTLRRGR